MMNWPLAAVIIVGFFCVAAGITTCTIYANPLAPKIECIKQRGKWTFGGWGVDYCDFSKQAEPSK